jgi:hypothetical protein
MSSQKRKLKTSTEGKTRTPEQVERYLELEAYDFNTIDRISRRTNASFYCVLQFDTIASDTQEAISMSGQEMDGCADEDEFRNNLKIV